MIRVALVLFCFTHLLGTHDRSAVIPKDIMYCAMYPRTLRFYNWAKYILEVIRDFSEKLKEDLVTEHRTLLLGGCFLYLQVTPGHLSSVLSVYFLTCSQLLCIVLSAYLDTHAFNS